MCFEEQDEELYDIDDTEGDDFSRHWPIESKKQTEDVKDQSNVLFNLTLLIE
jgi:hypothetical protein